MRSSFPIITIFKPIISGVSCEGNEKRISECNHHSDFFCPGSGGVSVAAVVCVEEQADLVPDLYALMSTTYLEDKHLFFLQVFYKYKTKPIANVNATNKVLCTRITFVFITYLQCAMEENCLASEAYRIRHENPDFSLETRRLLRFVYNISLQFTAQ